MISVTASGRSSRSDHHTHHASGIRMSKDEKIAREVLQCRLLFFRKIMRFFFVKLFAISKLIIELN